MTWEETVRSLIEDPSQLELAIACYFDLPLVRAAERYADGPEWREIRALEGAPRGMAVDIGAGNGIASFALARDDWQTVAIELHSSDLVVAGAIRQLAHETGWKG